MPIPVVKDERSSSTSNKFEPHPAGPEYVVLDLNRESISSFHDEFLEMENQWAKESCEAPTLEANKKDSTIESIGVLLLTYHKNHAHSMQP